MPMRAESLPPNMTSNGAVAVTPVRRCLAVLVADVVESVRLYIEDEAGTVERWRTVVDETRNTILPAFGGRLVKSLGDGLLVVFDDPVAAAEVASRLREAAHAASRGAAANLVLKLRLGLHFAEVIVDDIDIYGSGVNMAARLASLAAPGELVVSDAVRDRLVDGIDGELRDLGECYLKHLPEPVRAWALMPPGGAKESAASASSASELRASIAVLPFVSFPPNADLSAIGDVLADDLTNALVLQPLARVKSRLSTHSLAGRVFSVADAGRHLRARYIVSGRLRAVGEALRIDIELVDAQDECILWHERFHTNTEQLLVDDGRVAHAACVGIVRVLVGQELQRFAAAPLPNLAGYTALIGCIGSMHHMSRTQAATAQLGLEHLMERYPRTADPPAWYAKWHLLKAAQGWSSDPAAEAGRARHLLQRSLDLQGDHALALVMAGQLAAAIDGDAAGGLERVNQALMANPHEPLAWLYRSNLLAHADQAEDAVAAAERALSLSPIDPMRHMFDIFAAFAYLVAGRYDQASHHARAAVRRNALHLPSYPVLVAAEMHSGNLDGALKAGERFRALHPTVSVARYAARHRGTPRVVALCADAMRAAGLPN